MRALFVFVSVLGLMAPAIAADPPGRVDRFGDPLPAGALMRLGTLRGSAPITNFGVAADGSVVTVGSEADVRVWFPERDSPEPAVRLPVRVPDEWVIRSQVSPDGGRVACIAPDAVVVYERRGDRPPSEVAAFKIAGARSLTFSPDGAALAVVTTDPASAVHLCDVKAATSRVLADGIRHVEQVAFSGDGRRVGVSTFTGFVMWDAAKGDELARWALDGFALSAVALDRTGELLAARVYKSATEEYLDVRFLDAKTGKPRAGLTAAAGGHWVSFAPDGKTVLIGDNRGVRWWDPAAGRLLRQFDGATDLGHYSDRPPARFTADGKTLVATSGRVLFRWDAGTGEPRFRDVDTVQHFDRITALGASPGGKWYATGGGSRIKVWDAVTGKPATTTPAPHLRPNNLEFAPDGKTLYTPAPEPGQLTRWDVATGKEVRRFTADPKRPAQRMTVGLRLSEDGKMLTALTLARVQGTDTPLLSTWDAATGERQFTKDIAPFAWPLPHYRVNFSHNALHASTCGNVFLTADGPARDRLPERALGPGFKPGEFSGDGSRIAFSLVDGRDPQRRMQGVVYDTVTGGKLRDFPAGSGGRVALGPKGDVLAAAGLTDLTFWDVGTGELIAGYKSPTAEKAPHVYSFAEVIRFTPDGDKVITGHPDGTALVWAVPKRRGK